MRKTKSGNIALPPPALTVEQIVFLEKTADINMISRAALMRQAINNFLDQPEDQVAEFIQRDYGDGKPFTNIYCPPATAAALDALAEKFELPRNQIVRAAIQMYMEKQ